MRQPAAPDAAPSRPRGFRLPPGCVYLGEGVRDGPFTQWRVDCGPERNRDARRALGAALDAQGWRGCGVGLATATWAKGRRSLTVSEASGLPGDHIGLMEGPRQGGLC